MNICGSTPSQFLAGLPVEDQHKLAAGVYDKQFPLLKEILIDSLANEAGKAMFGDASVEELTLCPDRDWPAPGSESNGSAAKSLRDCNKISKPHVGAGSISYPRNGGRDYDPSSLSVDRRTSR